MSCHCRLRNRGQAAEEDGAREIDSLCSIADAILPRLEASDSAPPLPFARSEKRDGLCASRAVAVKVAWQEPDAFQDGGLAL